MDYQQHDQPQWPASSRLELGSLSEGQDPPNEHSAFSAQGSSLSGGLDPLGQQQATGLTFSRLLPPFTFQPRATGHLGSHHPQAGASAGFSWNQPDMLSSPQSYSQAGTGQLGHDDLMEVEWDYDAMQFVSNSLIELQATTGLPANNADFDVSAFLPRDPSGSNDHPGIHMNPPQSYAQPGPFDSYDQSETPAHTHTSNVAPSLQQDNPNADHTDSAPFGHHSYEGIDHQGHQVEGMYPPVPDQGQEDPFYWRDGAGIGPPSYSPLSITIVHPRPFSLAVKARMAEVLAWSPSSSSSRGMTTPPDQEANSAAPTSPPPPVATRYSRSPYANPVAPQSPSTLSSYPRFPNLGARSPPARPFTPSNPRVRYVLSKKSPLTQPRSTTTSPTYPQPQPKIPTDQSRGHRRVVSSSWNIHLDKPSTPSKPADPSVVQSAMFRLICLEPGQTNPTYDEARRVVGLDDLHDWLAIPNGVSSLKKVVTVLDPETGEAIAKITIRRCLGWQFIVLNVLYFRAFYFQIVAIPADRFPPELPKDDVIDGALVLMITSWITSMLAMRVCAGKAPLASEVRQFAEICLGSLEVTVLISIVSQFDLSPFTVEQIEELGWEKLLNATPGAVQYYRRRVAEPVVENVCAWHLFTFGLSSEVSPAVQVLQFHLDGSLGNFNVTLANMRSERICPDFAALWGSPYKLVDAVLLATSLSSNLHLVLRNPSEHVYKDVHSMHIKYTRQEGTDIAAETIAIVHQDILDGKTSRDNIGFFRNVLVGLGVTNAISYYAKRAPLALVRTFQEKANPWMEPGGFGEAFPYIGLLPSVAGNINAVFCSVGDFGTDVSAEKILGSHRLEIASHRKAICVKALLDHMSSGDTAKSNLEDLRWLNESFEQEALTAIRSLDESRRFWSLRSEPLVWDPLIPWVRCNKSFMQDFLSLYEKTGSAPGPREEGEVGEGSFSESPLTKLYDRVSSEWRHMKEVKEAEDRAGGPEPELEEPLEETLGSLVIFNMTHITPETAGAAWPMIEAGLQRARQALARDKKAFEDLLRPSDDSRTKSKASPMSSG